MGTEAMNVVFTLTGTCNRLCIVIYAVLRDFFFFSFFLTTQAIACHS